MLLPQLEALRVALGKKANRNAREESLLKELNSLASGGVALEEALNKSSRQETSAWGGDPAKCPVCGR
jgi:hypothetical protein